MAPLKLNRIFRVGGILVLMLLSACTPISTSSDVQAPTPADGESDSQEAILMDPISTPPFSLTHQRPDGNRIVPGTGGEVTQALGIPLAGKPLWLVAANHSDGGVWVAVLENGQVQAFRVPGEKAEAIELNIPSLPSGMPPVLINLEDEARLLVPPADASPLTHPVILTDGGMAYIDTGNQFRLRDEVLPAVSPMPDARILMDEFGRLLFLSDPTDIYDHGVLGDKLEAAALTLVDTGTSSPKIQKIRITDGDVIEGIQPIWVDVDRDGTREIIVTQSNKGDGARLVIYREDGSILAESQPIGKGYRWTNQLAVLQVIPDGSRQVATVRTPHIGGILEIYTIEGSQLNLTTSLPGYSTHSIGSRNLDNALVGDFNGDGIPEFVLPDQEKRTLSGVQYSDGQLKPVWQLPLDGVLGSNPAALALPGGGMQLGAATEEGNLRIWTWQ